MRQRTRPKIELRSPFPVDALPQFYQWCQSANSLLRKLTKPTFLEFFKGVIQTAFSLGIYGDGEIGGAFIAQPTDWKDGSPTDVNIALCLSRRLWGCGVMVPLCVEMVQQLFDQYPQLNSITSNVVGQNWPERRLLEAIGSKLEQTSPNAVTLGDKQYDLNLYRVTREDFYGMLRRS